MDKAILLVEDNPVNQKIAQKTLGLLGCQVKTVDNGEQALLVYKESVGKFSLILMDGEMAGLNGFDTTEAIRQWEQKKNCVAVPIIAWTANYGIEGNHQKWLAAGVSGFLPKPFKIEQIRKVLNNWLDEIQQYKIEPDFCLQQTKYSFDLQALQQLFELEKDSSGLIKRLIVKYEQQGGQLLQQLEHGCLQKDAASIKQAAHSFKSASASFGADELTQCCKQIEQSPTQFFAIEKQLEYLHHLFKQTLVALKELDA